MNQHPGRILQAMDRIQSVLSDEFDDLSPPDVHYVLSMLGYTYLEIGSKKFEQVRPK